MAFIERYPHVRSDLYKGLYCYRVTISIESPLSEVPPYRSVLNRLLSIEVLMAPIRSVYCSKKMGAYIPASKVLHFSYTFCCLTMLAASALGMGLFWLTISVTCTPLAITLAGSPMAAAT